MLTVSRLRMLVEVQRRGSIAAASQALNYTASAGSQQLSLLEREAGIPLLERGPRSVRLTEAGTRLAAHASRVLQQLLAAEQEMRHLAGLEQGTLRVAAFPSALPALIPPMLTALRDALPTVTVTVEDAEPAAALAALRRGDVDLAIVYDFLDQPLPRTTDLGVTPLGQDPFQLCVARDNPLAHQARVALATLSEAPWVIDGEPPAERTLVARHLAGLGLTPRVAVRSNDSLAVLTLVAADVGIALLPRLQVAAGHPVTTIPVDPTPAPRRVHIAHRTSSTTTPLHNRALPLIIERLTAQLDRPQCDLVPKPIVL